MKNESLLAKKIIAEIVRHAGGAVGAARLYKAFYFAHLFYAESAPDYLTNWPIVRMQNGPGIDEGEELLHELVATGVLRTETVPIGPYRETRYAGTDKQLPGPPLSAEAVAAIREAAQFVMKQTATELSDLTHEHSRSWNQTEDGKEMNIYIDTIPDDEYETRRTDLALLRKKIAEARLVKEGRHERVSEEV